MKTKRLPGFTILEALISLILTGIIIGLVYSLFTLLDKQLLSFKNESVQLNMYNLNNTLLKEDIANSSLFNYDETSFVLKKYDDETITYRARDNRLLRERNGLVDTLDLTMISASIQEGQEEDITVIYNIRLFNKSIKVNYYLEKCNASIINEQFFN